MEGKKATEVELRLFEELDLADVDVLQREDALCGLDNLVGNDVRHELSHELVESNLRGLSGHDLGHLLANLADLRRLGVGGLLELTGDTLGEADGEDANEVVIGGLDGDVALDESLPLANERAQLVVGEVEAVEVGEDIRALNLVNAQTNAASSVVLAVLEVGKGNVENTALELLVGALQTSGAVHKSLTHVANIEGSRSLDRVPFLTSEGVNSLLLVSLLALAKSLVLTNSHCCLR